MNSKSKAQNQNTLRPPQFGLKTLLGVVALVGALLALCQWLEPITVAAIAFVVVSVLLHVAGNCIGTRLRQIGDSPLACDELPAPRQKPRPQDFAPVTQLGRRNSLGWSIVIASSVGIASGAVGGGLWTFAAGRGNIGMLNIGVGVVAFAVLGGLAAFAMVSFAQVLLGAIWQSMRE